MRAQRPVHLVRLGLQGVQRVRHLSARMEPSETLKKHARDWDAAHGAHGSPEACRKRSASATWGAHMNPCRVSQANAGAKLILLGATTARDYGRYMLATKSNHDRWCKALQKGHLCQGTALAPVEPGLAEGMPDVMIGCGCASGDVNSWKEHCQYSVIC